MAAAAEERACLRGRGAWSTANEECKRMARRILAVVLIILLCGTASVSGQLNEGGLAPDNIQELPMKRPFLEYALAGCSLLAAMAIGFKTSKRTHD